MSYKEVVYKYYRSKFKGATDDNILLFGATRIAPILKPWVKDLKPDLPVVDLGCGAGELLIALQNLGLKNLTGCDLSAEQVNVASRRFPSVVESDLFSYLNSHADSYFQLITIFDVIEHLTAQETFDLMTIVYRKLLPGGRLIVHLPNGVSPFVGYVFWGDLTHEWCLTPDSAGTLCSLHGFNNFEAVEHLGTGRSVKGAVRQLAWVFVRNMLKLVNTIETGNSGGNIWTRNFAFKADKPGDIRS